MSPVPRPWPDLAELALLAAVPDHGSLSAAARACGMAQPNASRAVRRLEAAYGGPLIVRATHGSRLSALGQDVVDAARPLLAQARDFGARVDALTGAGPLLVAASQTIGECLAGAWLAEVYAREPDVAVGLQVCNSDEVVARVDRGEVRVGFVESARVGGALHRTVVARDRLLVLVAPTHPWAARHTPVTRAELAATPLVVREQGSGTRGVLDDRLGSPARALVELSSNTAVLAAVAADLGPAVLSELASRAALADGRVVAVPVGDLDLTRHLHAVWRTPARLRGAARLLVDIAAG